MVLLLCLWVRCRWCGDGIILCIGRYPGVCVCERVQAEADGLRDDVGERPSYRPTVSHNLREPLHGDSVITW